MIFKSLYDDEDIIIPPINSKPQKQQEEQARKRTKAKDISLLKKVFSLVKYLANAITFPPRIDPRDPLYSCELSQRRPRVFAIQLVGQELPQEYSEQAPPSTIVIAIDTEDYPEHSYFLAQPVSLATLKQELQRDTPKNNKNHNERLRFC